MGEPSSKFGPRNLNGRTFHYGVDYPAPIGSPVYNNKDLTVTKATQQTGYGNVVYAVDNQGTEYRFAHLDSIPAETKPGAVLPAGSKIAYTGITGTEKDGSQTSTGAHLHYEVRIGGKAVDPLTTIDPTTGKSYDSNATFDLSKPSLRSSTPTPSSDVAPKSRSITPAPSVPGAPQSPQAPQTNKTQKNTVPGPSNPQRGNVKILINPLLRLGDI